MMEFRTKVDVVPFGWRIGHDAMGVSLGSCFAGNIAAKLKRAKFPVADNPFGVLFNPVSIADAVEVLAEGRGFTRDDLFYDGDVWGSFAFHGSFSSPDAAQALGAMNRAAEEGRQALERAAYVIITFGTAWVYEHAETGRVVANCHRFPAATFRRRRLSVAEITERYDALVAGPLRGKRIILTVSPVRHAKDGFPENTLSKAVLIEAVHELVARHPDAEYFPAFEIVNDELRDYRFYGADMVHPSVVAVDYIWERFREAALTPRAAEAVGEIEKLAAAMEHRPLDPASASHARFLVSMLQRTEALSMRYPEIDFSRELAYFGGVQ